MIFSTFYRRHFDDAVDLQAKYKAGELARDKKEEELQKQTEEGLHRLAVQFEAERKEREVKFALVRITYSDCQSLCLFFISFAFSNSSPNPHSLHQLRSEIDSERNTRVATADVIKQSIVENVAVIKESIVKESKVGKIVCA